VRELENFIERGVIMHAGARHLPFEPPSLEGPRSEQALLGEARAERWTMERLEREYILEVLQETGGHRGRTADILGIDRRTLYRKLKQYSRDGGPRPVLQVG
jgi:DNA-binding NtrC family response regulator